MAPTQNPQCLGSGMLGSLPIVLNSLGWFSPFTSRPLEQGAWVRQKPFAKGPALLLNTNLPVAATMLLPIQRLL